MKNKIIYWCLSALALVLLCGMPSKPVLAQRPAKYTIVNNIQYGIASYYADKFNGRKTASGSIFSNKKMTAAHNTLPLGTHVKVTNQRNGKWVIVEITDRLHYKSKRLIDLTQTAAQKLHFIKRGLTRVKVEVVPGEMLPAIEMNSLTSN